MQKSDIDKIVARLFEEGWQGKSHKDFAVKLGEEFSYGQVERIRVRYRYLAEKRNDEKQF